MLVYNGWRMLLDTVTEGVEVTVLGPAGWVCTVTGPNAKTAVASAIEAAEATRAVESTLPPPRVRHPFN